MAGERTESATPGRRGEMRKKGQFAKSADFNSAVTFSVGLYLLFIYVPLIVDRLKYISIYTFTNIHPSQINPANLSGILSPYMSVLVELVLPFLLILMVTGVILWRVQVGHLFSLEIIKPDFAKLSPMTMVNGLKGMINVFSPRVVVELLKSFLKMVIVGAFAYSVIDSRKQDLLGLLGVDIGTAFNIITSILAQMLYQICIAMVIIGIVDKKYQHYEFEKSIKMTKSEVKDEAKNKEGDPTIKAKIKAIQFQFAMQRMMSAIPQADVIVTNPTHYAVALRYDQNVAPAPQVIAKGVDFVAFRIREIAENNNIPIVENKPLARTLYKIVPLDGLIPAELYVAVAELLAYVYKTNKGSKK